MVIEPGSPLTSSGRNDSGRTNVTSWRSVLKTTLTVPVAEKPVMPSGRPIPPPAPISMLPATPKPWGPARAISSAVAWP